MKKSKKSKNGSIHVPGQYLGFSLQASRFLFRLLEADDDWQVSLEVFEDVGAESSEGQRIAEQVKSTHGGNPVSDSAVELWKTLSNWIDSVERGELDPEKTVFEIYVSQPKSGEIVQSFANAKTIKEAQLALKRAKTKLWGKPPTYKLKRGIAASIRKYLNKVFTADMTTVSKIIQQFHLERGSGSPHSDLKKLFKKFLIPDEIQDDTLQHALGWVKQQTDILLEHEKLAIISVNTFRKEIISFVRKHDNRTILTSFAKNPGPEEIAAGRLKTYVRQLEFIDADDDKKIEAIIDFLKASVDRTHWSVKGLVHESSFHEFEHDLVKVWENLKTKVDIHLRDRKEVERGQALYADCSLHRSKLEGLETPSHFTPGSFHALADRESVGWHPDYKTKLRTPEDEGTK